MALIQYEDFQTRWGARAFCSLLVPAFFVFYILNMEIFSWDSFLETVF
jgi:hypothetical protein